MLFICSFAHLDSYNYIAVFVHSILHGNVFGISNQILLSIPCDRLFLFHLSWLGGISYQFMLSYLSDIGSFVWGFLSAEPEFFCMTQLIDWRHNYQKTRYVFVNTLRPLFLKSEKISAFLEILIQLFICKLPI